MAEKQKVGRHTKTYGQLRQENERLRRKLFASKVKVVEARKALSVFSEAANARYERAAEKRVVNAWKEDKACRLLLDLGYRFDRDGSEQWVLVEDTNG